MEKIFQSEFQEIFFETKNSMMKVVWENTENLTDELYRKELFLQLKNIEKLRPLRMLIDTSTFSFVIMPSTQEWNNQNILKKVIETNLHFAAFLISPEIFSQVSIEQNMEEEKTGTLQSQYFENETLAYQWLISQSL